MLQNNAENNTRFIKKIRCPVRIDFAGGTTDVAPYAEEQGGAVLNAAINYYVEGTIEKTSDYVNVNYTCKLPLSSGLGTSGAMNLCWLALVREERDPQLLAEMVYAVEQARGERGGKQDQYASAFGGINLFEFREGKVKRTPVTLSQRFLTTFQEKLVLVYSGVHRLAKDQNQEMMVRYKANNQQVVAILNNIKRVTYKMVEGLQREDLSEFPNLMNEEWSYRKQLRPDKTNPELEAVIAKGLQMAKGAKVCGAAGGGCILFFTDDKEKFKAHMHNYPILDFTFDHNGMQIEEQEGANIKDT